MQALAEAPLYLNDHFSDRMLNIALAGLRGDRVILWGGLNSKDADRTIYSLAERLGLAEQLEVQAGFASVLGHRKNVGRYFMSVNNRNGFQFVTPHSEGGSFSNIQMAALYCYENNTDGGVSILLGPDETDGIWNTLRERKTKVQFVGRPLSVQESVRAKAMYKVNLTDDLLDECDQVLGERVSQFANLKLFDVLSPVQKTYSKILDKEFHAYWDTVSSIDFRCCSEYALLLRQLGLLRGQIANLSDEAMDSSCPRRVWHSNIKFDVFFKRRVVHKLAPGELFIFNNITWTHSTSNWDPESGNRFVVAAFA